MSNKNKNKALTDALNKGKPNEPEKVSKLDPNAADTSVVKKEPAKGSDVPAPTQTDEAPVQATAKPVDVVDASGKVLFRRRVGTAEANLHVRPNETIKTKKPRMFKKGKEKANASNLAFPSDRWGVTKDLKVAFIQTAQRVSGDENKRDLVLKTLAVLAEHFEAKFEKDFEYRQDRAAEARLRADEQAELEAKAAEDAADGKVPEAQ